MIELKKYLWYVIVFSILLVLLVAMIMPYIPLYGEELGLTVSMIGYVIALYHITQVVGRVPLGTLSDFVGYKKIITLGGVSVFLGSLFYVISSVFWPFLFFAQVLYGLAVSVTWVAIPAFMTEFGRERIPIFTFSVGWAYTFAVPLGGFIMGSWGMDMLFYIACFTSLLLLVLVALLRRNYPSLGDVDGRKSDFPSIISVYKKSFRTLRNPGMLRACLFSFLMFMSFAIGFSIFPLYLSGIGLTSALIGIVQFSRMSTSSSLRLFSRRIIRRIGRNSILTGGTVLVGFFMFLISYLESLPLLILVSIAWGLSGGLYSPIVFNLIADATDARNRGTGMGLRGTMGTLGSSLGVISFSNLAEVFTVPISLSLTGIAIMVGAIFAELFLRIRGE